MPTLGDIYTAHNARFDRYFAFQFTHHDEEHGHGVLLLDWWAPTPPNAAALNNLTPAVLDFMGWNNQQELHWVGHALPQDIEHAGWRNPLAQGPLHSHADWPDGSCLQQQRWWNSLDPAMTSAYKQEMARDRYDDTVILAGKGISVARGATRLEGKAMNAAPSLDLFNTMPALTTLHVDVPVPGLLPWLATRPLIYELILSGAQGATLDLRGTHLSRLSVDVTGMRTLYLNDGLDTLILRGTASDGLTIHDAHGGRWLDLDCTDPGLLWSGLPQLQQINLYGMRALDAARVADRLPGLRALSVHGPCRLDNLHQLGRLSSLEHLSLVDVFPPADARFPDPSQWPQLSSVSLDSVPAELAHAVKTSFGPRVAHGVDLEIRQPRKPEWLALNMDNPFRDWGDGASITPAQAKKAATLYRLARKDALKSASLLAGQRGEMASSLQNMAATYIEGFNALDRRGGILGTSECEQILQALDTILDAVDQAWLAQSRGDGTPLARQSILDLVETLREF